MSKAPISTGTTIKPNAGAMMTLGSREELNDLIAWSHEHAQNPRTCIWLSWNANEWLPEFVEPVCVPIPVELADDVEALTDSWLEVLVTQQPTRLPFKTQISRAMLPDPPKPRDRKSPSPRR